MIKVTNLITQSELFVNPFRIDYVNFYQGGADLWMGDTSFRVSIEDAHLLMQTFNEVMNPDV